MGRRFHLGQGDPKVPATPVKDYLLKLAIISHTEHYRDDTTGQIVGWGPTVREINHLLELFDEIWHIAVFHNNVISPPSALPYASDKIHFVALKPFGGPHLLDKLGILVQAPSVVHTVYKVLRQVDWWQFRAPTGIGVFLIPFLSLFVKKNGWYKYAGNWAQENPPLGYRWQRFWLSRLQKRKVTINGFWPNQPKHCISFENPCLEEIEIETGRAVLKNKVFKKPFVACFVGRLDDAKGVDILLKVLKTISPELLSEMHLIGDGPQKETYQTLAKSIPIKVVFHGFLPKSDIIQYYIKSHFFILLSRGEGFPKVLAEAINYGCIPIVSGISSIPHYIQDRVNGFLIPYSVISQNQFDKGETLIVDAMIHENLTDLVEVGRRLLPGFTYSNYNLRIFKEITNAL